MIEQIQEAKRTINSNIAVLETITVPSNKEHERQQFILEYNILLQHIKENPTVKIELLNKLMNKNQEAYEQFINQL